MTQNGDRDRGGLEKTGEAVGEFAGRMMGKAGDTAVDLTGRMFDSMASVLGGWWSGDDARTAANGFGDEHERECRRHFDSTPARGSMSYESTRPLYQFGHVARQSPEYRNRSFTDVEPELRRAWESAPGSSRPEWSTVRDYVGFSFGWRPDSGNR